MKNAILIHGTCDKEEYFDSQYPSLSNSHWFPWLQKQLLMQGILDKKRELLEIIGELTTEVKREKKARSNGKN